MVTREIDFNTLHHKFTVFLKLLNLCVKPQLEGKSNSKVAAPNSTVCPLVLHSTVTDFT